MPRPAPILDFLAVGDTMLDVFVEIHEAAVNCALNHEECRISFAFGEKVPVERITKLPGAGNASNAAISSRRLGRNTAIYAVVGGDPEGKAILERWKQERIPVTFVQKAPDQASNYSTVLSFQGERTILVYHQPYAYVFPKKLPAVRRIYYTSMGKQHEAFEAELLRYLGAHPNTRLTFQPGTHQLRRFARGMKDILARTEILVLNKEEAAAFLETDLDTPPRDQLKALRAFGPETCVITDGENGSIALRDGEVWTLERFPVPCLERTGAGDAYASAFTWAIDQKFSLPEAMRYGTANAASVIQFVGPHEGLLDREGLNRFLRKYASIRPKRLSL